jgi:hypothetical protein
MSSPTQALYFDKNNKIIHTVQADAGELLNAETIYAALLKLPYREGTSYVRLYNLQFAANFLAEMGTYPSKNKDAAVKKINELIEIRSKEYANKR